MIAALLLGAAARFFHFALFQGELLSLPSYVCDTAIFVIAGMLAWRATRANQMVQQYPWLYARSGPLGWREIEARKPELAVLSSGNVNPPARMRGRI